MVVVFLIVTVIVFILADAVLRIVLKKMEQSKLKKERAEALDIGLRLDFTDEAKSLKRVEVDHPKAKILAVDDEEVVLASFRKILVLAGYAIDTVETGPEALGLLKKTEYDFLFTDLKMPVMDGVEVTKAAKHLRPDIDIIVITGYATIETAVATMKYGATDYVQKPFTEDELVDFVNKSLIRRQDKIERVTKPAIHLITPSHGESKSSHEFNVPAGIFFAPTHTWVRIDLNGLARVGIDDFSQKILSKIESVVLPKKGQKVKKGDTLFTIQRGDQSLSFPAPISGVVVSVNPNLEDHIDYVNIKPYELGWMCNIEPENLNNELPGLKIGSDTMKWYQKEIDRFHEISKTINARLEESSQQEGKSASNSDRFVASVWAAYSEYFHLKSFE